MEYGLKEGHIEQLKAMIKGTWIDTSVRKGDVVNVLGLDDTKSDWIVDDLNGILVINPDLLISGTSIVSTLFCMRKAVLNERFKVSYFNSVNSNTINV